MGSFRIKNGFVEGNCNIGSMQGGGASQYLQVNAVKIYTRLCIDLCFNGIK